jgi:hypothetical protein
VEIAKKPVTSLATLLPAMEAFHRRYMVSNKVLRLWADMVSTLEISMIVPQHGAPGRPGHPGIHRLGAGPELRHRSGQLGQLPRAELTRQADRTKGPAECDGARGRRRRSSAW